MSDKGTYTPPIRTTFNVAPDTYLVPRVTTEMMRVMWSSMSEPQREEFRTIYGERYAELFFYKEIRDAEHSAAIFVGPQLACLMWTGWSAGKNGKRLRTMGCVCSEYAIRNPVGFVKRTRAGRDAFLMSEPPDVEEVFVCIDGTFQQSRNWAVRVCDFREYCRLMVNGKEVVCYHYKIGGW
jgi:hypothetical protein